MDLDELARAAQTDRAAARSLFEQLGVELTGFVSGRYRLPEAEVDDIVQSALLVVHRKLGAFVSQGPGSLLRWARVIASLETRAAIRRQPENHQPALWGPSTPETGLSSKLSRAQLGAVLRAEARELPSYDRRVIEHELDDGDLDEFAATEQVSRAAARSIRWRARKRLATRLLERLGIRPSAESSSTPAS